MEATDIIAKWKQNIFRPIYWLEGEEPYFIDKIMDYAEHHLLSEAEVAFNLTIFYGKDANWVQIVNACRRYPIQAERQVVLLKEAQSMKDLAQLESYIQSPSNATVFVVSHKEKKVDGKTKLGRLLKQKTELFSTKKLYENKVEEWANNMILQHGLTISPKGLAMLVSSIGNDLTIIENEVKKIVINLGVRKNITEADIEQYIGISKEYNVFELQNAVREKNLAKALRIIQYFESNPKAAPLPMVLSALYSFFVKIYMVHGLSSTKDSNAIATLIGVPPFLVPNYTYATKYYDYAATERAILLLHQYNLRSLGIGDAGTAASGLLKEVVFKIVM